MTSITCISDTHTFHGKLGFLDAGDILIHAGDVSSQGHPQDYAKFAYWFGEQDFEHKVVIAGNHDITLETHPAATEHFFDKVHYLMESSVEVAGLQVYGTPWSPWFHGDIWSFNVHLGEDARARWACIPEDTDILVVHGPPYGYGDRCYDGREVGCPDLLKRIEEIQPKLVVSGHIHEGYGVYETPWGTKIVNASVLDQNYRLSNAPIRVEL